MGEFHPGMKLKIQPGKIKREKFLRILYYMEKIPVRGEFHPGMKFSFPG